MNTVSDKYASVDTGNLVNRLDDSFGDILDLPNLRNIEGTGTREYVEIPLKHSRLVGGDEVIPNLLLTNSHQGESSLRINLGFLRLVCGNGMMVGESVFEERVRHVKGKKMDEFLSEFEIKINYAVSSLDHQFEVLERMVQVKVTPAQQLGIILDLSEKKLLTNRARDNAFHIVNHQDYRRDADTIHQGNIYGLWNVINEELRRTATQRTSQARLIERNKKLLDSIFGAALLRVAA